MLGVFQKQVDETISSMNQLVGDNDNRRNGHRLRSGRGQCSHEYTEHEDRGQKIKSLGESSHHNSSSTSSMVTNEHAVTVNNRWSITHTNSSSNILSTSFSNGQPRRISTLSDITFESDDHHFPDDTDAHTTDSNDSSMANNSYTALLLTARRFASQCSLSFQRNGMTIEEMHQSVRSSGGTRSSCANTAAPVIPRRRVSVKCLGDPGNKRKTDRPELNHCIENEDIAKSKGNSAPPALPKRSVSVNQKSPSKYSRSSGNEHTSISNPNFPDNTSGTNYVCIPESDGDVNGGSLKSTLEVRLREGELRYLTNTTLKPSVRKSVRGLNKGSENFSHRRLTIEKSSKEGDTVSMPSTDPPILPERRASGYMSSHALPLAYLSDEFSDECEVTMHKVAEIIEETNACLFHVTDNSTIARIPRHERLQGDESSKRDPLNLTTQLTEKTVYNQSPNVLSRQLTKTCFQPPLLDSNSSHKHDLSQPPIYPVRKDSSHSNESSSVSKIVVPTFLETQTHPLTSQSPQQSSRQPPMKPIRQASDFAVEQINARNSSSIAIAQSSMPLKSEASKQPPAIPTRQASHSAK